MNKKIIITGATGFIGHALMAECIANHDVVYAICRQDSPRLQSIPQHESIHIVKADLSDLQAAAAQIPANCDVFYHLGWMGTLGIQRNDMFLQTQNIRYTLDAVLLAHQCGCSTFIGAGSQAEYGRYEGTLAATTPAFPENGYGMAKLCAGQMSREVAQQHGMKHVWARILSVYGPYDHENTMIMSTIKCLLNGQHIALTKGEQNWDYLYVKDAAAMMYALLEHGKDGKIYCIGSGISRPLKEYIDIMHYIINPQLDIGLGELPYQPKQVMNLCADISDIHEDLFYQVQYSFEQGIKETIEWYKNNIRK